MMRQIIQQSHRVYNTTVQGVSLIQLELSNIQIEWMKTLFTILFVNVQRECDYAVWSGINLIMKALSLVLSKCPDLGHVKKLLHGNW